MTYAVEMKGIRKTFPGVVANDEVTIRVRSGSILCLVGENGAGKTTLMNILYGLEQPEAGEILVRGQPVHFASSADAIKAGIGMVHQHFMLVPDLTVLENIILGHEPVRRWGINWNRARTAVLELSQRYGFELPLQELVRRLPVGLQQKVEILKLLYRGAEILILDEPTAVLTPQETGELFANLRSLAGQGKTIILITHKLDEVMQVADHVVVMRKGRVVQDLPARETTAEEIAYFMVGRRLPEVEERKPHEKAEVILSLQRITVADDSGFPAVRELSLDLHRGEIVGVAGVSGNGQRELAQAVAGLRGLIGGDIYAGGTKISSWERSRRREWGISYIPEDRTHVGLCLPWSVEDNLIAGFHRHKPLSGVLGRLDRQAIARWANDLIGRFDIRTPSRHTPVGTLSGGNQQKVTVAREVAGAPPVIVAHEPTRGVDVGAIHFVHNQLMLLRNAGSAILLISSDLDEILKLSDRIAVIFRGEIVALLSPGRTSRQELGFYMAGLKRRSGDEAFSAS